ncbi:MAG: polysaccharide pyruvyl transferase family protein [Rhodocyclaceae bacterium]|nr:MAG: polysaccharide pyruvyl transferase family protein [Rhodocyclaceae bacterium]
MEKAPTILFGAFDRHNFGDLLFPHIAAALLPGVEPIFAGLAERDLRPFGGHRVQALAELAGEYGTQALNLIHVGGEVLSCEAWQAALMLQTTADAGPLIACYDRHPENRRAWARQQTGLADRAPYCTDPGLFPAARVIYAGVGGVSLDQAEPALRSEVLAKLAAAHAVGVRDRVTLAHLQAAGISAELMPDPAVLVAELFSDTIRRHRHGNAVADMLRRFPSGYLAVQFSADFGDDTTLAGIANQLALLADARGIGIVLFRAGAAPWHDALDGLERVAHKLGQRAQVFPSLHLWDICALIAASRGFCGSSLHGRIVATAKALPRLNFAQRGEGAKQAAWAASWEAPDLPGVVDIGAIATGMARALDAPVSTRERLARDLATRYREGWATLLKQASVLV